MDFPCVSLREKKICVHLANLAWTVWILINQITCECCPRWFKIAVWRLYVNEEDSLKVSSSFFVETFRLEDFEFFSRLSERDLLLVRNYPPSHRFCVCNLLCVNRFVVSSQCELPPHSLRLSRGASQKSFTRKGKSSSSCRGRLTF